MKKYIVGGWVRDKLLSESGRPMKTADKDWVVTGATPEQMVKAGFRPVGSDFPVFLHPKTQEEYALARTERKSGHGYKGFVFFAEPSVSLEEDLLRRDLTVNAMALDEEGSLIDPYGGLQDLKNKILRHVSPAFEEDPLRILRLARFHAKLPDFCIDPGTREMAERLVSSGEADHLVPERVSAEIRKALKEPQPSLFFAELLSFGYLSRVYPLWRIDEFSMGLLDSLDESFDEEDRLASALASVSEQVLPKLLDQLHLPKKMNEYAELFVKSLSPEMAQAASGREYLSLLRRKDALRRPERFEKLLRLLKKAGVLQCTDQWTAALQAVKQIDFQKIASESADKKTVPQKIEAASIEAIDRVLKQFADEHQNDRDQNSAC